MRIGCALVITLLLSTAPLALATRSVVGKTVSTVSISDAPPLGVPTVEPVAYLAVPVPRKYRSGRDFLLIEADVQAVCTEFGSLYATIDVGGIGAEPDPNESFQTVREGDPGASIAFVTRRWFLPPSPDPAPTAAAVVRLLFRSEDSPGFCTLMNGSLTIRIAR